MSSVVFASPYAGSQAVKKWLIQNKKYVDSDLTKLANGDTIVIAGHDVELGDGTAFLKSLPKVDLSKINFSVILIVCSAQTFDFTKQIETPAETIANYFNRNVLAATNTVTADISNLEIVLGGNFQIVSPQSDVNSLFSKLSITQ